MGDRFAAVQRLYDVYLQRFRRVGGELLVCIAKGYCCCAANRPRRDVELASRCWQNSTLSRVGIEDAAIDV